MKKFNFKAIFVDHGEKLGFGFILLLVLGIIGTSEWFPYDKDPSEIITKADNVQRQIQENVWPEDARKSFTIRDYGQNIRDLRGPLATTGYDYSTPLWQPLYRPQQLAKDPQFLAVMELEAKAGMFVLAVAPKSETDPNAPETTTAATATTVAAADDDEFARPTTSAPNPFGGAGAGAFGAHGMPAGHAGGAGALSPPGIGGGHAGAMGAHGGAGMLSGMMPEGMVGEYGGMSLAPGVTGRGERFVSVRGVWPVLQQLQQYRSSMNLATINDARALLEIVDFVLERKTAVAGANPWSGDWQPIEITRAKEVLAECPDFDIDIFDPRLVDVTITMPLPKRLLGRWGDYATHPQIKDFQLKGPELERELKLQEKLMQQYERMSARIPQKPKARGGFSGTQTNFRGMADMMYSSPTISNEFYAGMNSSMQNDPSMMSMGSMSGSSPNGRPLPPAALKDRLTAAERLFLFRYFDFDVRPGYAYRYRVKLQLRNPNYQRPLDQVIDKSVAEGETRETQWSADSTVAVVPETTNYFLKTVNRDPVQEAVRSASKAMAYIKMFQWDQTVGTMIADTIQVSSIGQFLGEKRKSWHLDVAKRSFREEDVVFQTEDLYLDGVGDARLNLEDHKDLKIPGDKKGMLGLSSTAVVMTEVGELKAIAPGMNHDKEKIAQDRVDRERKGFEDIKGKDPAAAINPLGGGGFPGGEGALSNPYGDMPGMGGPNAKKKGKAKPNPRKMGAMGMGMPGMMGP